MTGDDRWQNHAACRNVDPAVMFPDNWDTLEIAKRVCARCPVTAECLAYAQDPANQIVGGVWGGQCESERFGRARRGPVPKPCGTRAAYERGCHCDPCSEASRAYQAARELRRKARLAASTRPQDNDGKVTA